MGIPIFEDQKREEILLSFVYGNPVLETRLFTTAFEVSSFGGFDFQPLPRMQFDIAENTEGISPQATTVSLDTTEIDHLPSDHQEYLEFLMSDDPMPRTYIVINRLVTSLIDGTQTYEFLYKGEITKRERNPQGRVGVIEIESNNPKSIEKISSGFLIGPTCNNTFGFGACARGIDLSSLVEVGTVAARISGTGFLVQITGLSTESSPNPHWPEYWLEGSVEKGGHTLKIVNWSEDEPDVFQLERKVPEAWIGTTAQIRPGCLKDLPACIRWDNVLNSTILGRNLQSTHPIVETNSRG